ncbi:3-deoxy-manno-octulosonate cytidylyltransferase [Pseudodesulfovibrio hydrargyri]|uniref:3-deoxy-manno-octulosonate cytidylyltransferase n=1 Tax=Pseudodesulfovibrio hydrargyri TaxID=2125990 RepID=A0A1J5N371_9BACT|nr:NTP transferase domain-containing protein [Pseudodesulfovibrio hydrargyri]OIQ50067.1 3-deoxy-manno-octulosonate cytidylyltransferase [Pseudodesulfovibrio hydrargyri]
MTTIGAFIQARMSSSRLPGKVLKEISGKPLLEYVFERMEKVQGLDFFVVATSSDDSDRPVRDFCRSRAVPCYGGPLDDVALRFVEAAREYPCDAMLRYCADSPLVDVAVMARALALFRATDADVVTNVHPRTYPAGHCVEVVRSDVFARAYPLMKGPELEHNTMYFYNNDDKFKITNFECEEPCAGECNCVDTAADHAFLERLVSAMSRPHWTYGWKELSLLAEQIRGGSR